MENVLLPKEPVRSGDQIKLRLTEEAGSEGIVPVCLPFLWYMKMKICW